MRGSQNDCSVTCWVTAKISFSFDLHVCTSMSLVQSVSQSVTQCTLTSHYATEFTVNAYNLVGVTFVHNLCVPNVHTMTEEEEKRKNKNNNNIVIACVWWYFSRHHIFSLYHFHQIDLVMSSCSLISFWLAVKIIVSPTIFSMKTEEKNTLQRSLTFFSMFLFLFVLNSHVKKP